MKWLIIGLSCLTGGFTLAQARKFYDRVELLGRQDSLYPLAQLVPDVKSPAEVAYAWQTITQACMLRLQKELGKKNTLVSSRFLCGFAAAMQEGWHLERKQDKKGMQRIIRAMNKGKRPFKMPYSELSPVVIQVPLLKNNRGVFYLDKKDNSSPFHLYKGKEKSKDKASVPLDAYSDDELVELICRCFYKSRYSKGFSNGSFSYVGVSIHLNENSLHKNAIPTASIVILLGASRLKLVK